MAILISKKRAKPRVNEGFTIPIAGYMACKGIVWDFIHWMCNRACRENIHHQLLGIKIPMPLKAFLRSIGHIKHLAVVIQKPGPIYCIINLASFNLNLTSEILPHREHAQEQNGSVYGGNFAFPDTFSAFNIHKVIVKTFLAVHREQGV